ncbi:hypothetical protein BGZ76_002240 [Entomortierella beljakovae]|nr:hypothetical protein BGZ76_002240 [Entomortierella beljakovae]
MTTTNTEFGLKVTALNYYCNIKNSPKPAFYQAEINDEFYCKLVMPFGRIFRTRSPSLKIAKSDVVTKAWQTLVIEGEMTHVYEDIHSSRLTTLDNGSAVSKVELDVIEQWKLGLEYLDLETLRSALSPVQMYPRTSLWEVIGRTFYKFYITTYVFANHQSDTAGMLSKRTGQESRIQNISQLLISSPIFKYIDISIRNNVCAVARRMISAAIISGGVNNAIRVIGFLGMKKDSGTITVEGLYVQYQLHRPVEERFPYMMSHIKISQSYGSVALRAESAHRILGYKFIDLNLFVNSTENSGIEFKRLEFLGDAVLEFLVADHFTSFRSRSSISFVLSNNVLGTLFVSLGLDSVVDPTLELRAAIKEAKCLIESRTKLKYISVKKVLGNAMEGIIGGIFLDSGFNLEIVREVLSRTLFPFVKQLRAVEITPGMSKDFPITLSGVDNKDRGDDLAGKRTASMLSFVEDGNFRCISRNNHSGITSTPELVNINSKRDPESCVLARCYLGGYVIDLGRL